MKDLIITEKNNIVTQRRKKKNNSEKKNLFEIYKSEKTLKDYFFYLNNFLSYVYDGSNPIELEEIVPLMSEIEKSDAEDYISHLINERKLKKTSINKIISGLKSLYKELEKNGLEKNPFKHIETFKTARNIDNILKLSYNDITEILKKYKVADEKMYRNTVILYTLFYTGMRSSELLSLKFKHILKRDDEYFIKLEKTKSGKEQFKSLHNFLVDKISDFKNYLKNLYNVDDEYLEDIYIFHSSFENNKQLSYRSLYDVVQSLGNVINKNISPHNVRHAVATELSLGGADLIEIRDFLGHADTKVTEIYINAKSIIEKKVLEKLPTDISE